MANRKQQIVDIQKKIESIAEEVEGLISVLEDALENMPENLRGSLAGEKAADRIDMLQGWADQLTEMAEEADV